MFKKAPVAQEELIKARVCGKWEQVLSLEQRYKNKSAISSMHSAVYYRILYCIVNYRWTTMCSEGRGNCGAMVDFTNCSSTS